MTTWRTARIALVFFASTVAGFGLSARLEPRPARAHNSYCCNGEPIRDDNSECDTKGGVEVHNTCTTPPDNGSSSEPEVIEVGVSGNGPCEATVRGAMIRCATMPNPPAMALCVEIAMAIYSGCKGIEVLTW